VSLSQITIKNRVKSIARILLPVIFLAVFWAPKIIQAQSTPPTSPDRTIQDFLTLWGTDYNENTNRKEELKKASVNGIGYLGPVEKSEGGVSEDGTIKKIRTVISLSIDNSKKRAWNMVAGTYSRWWEAGTNKWYLRLLNQSFVARIYQKDSSGSIINESIVPVPVCSFVDCNNSNQAGPDGESTRIEWAKRGIPSNRIVKFRSGAAWGSNLGNDYEDGYTVGPDGGDVTITGAGNACAAGGAAATVVPIGVTTVGGCVLGSIAYVLLDTDGPVLILRQTANIVLPITSTLEKGTTTYIDLWYMGSSRLSTSDDSLEGGPFVDNNPRIKIFNIPIQGGYDSKKFPFYQIGGVYEFTTPKTLEESEIQASAANQESSEIGANLTTNDNRFLPVCSIVPGVAGSVMGCVAQILYHGVFRPVAFFAMLMGKLFDFFIGYSLSDESYRHDFIQTGWQLVRDISNIFFIVIMIYSGLAAVFSTSNVSYKKIIPTLVINALIINFSLFATRIVIDMSNIVARIFYNQMVVKIDGQEQSGEEADSGYKPISEAIVSSFNPQKIFETKVLNSESSNDANTLKSSDEVSFNSQTSNLSNGTKYVREDKEYAGYFTLVTLVAIAISFSMAMMFWKTAFMFVGRVIGLYVAMIFSPFAFLSRGNVPLVNKIGSMNFSSWWGNLSKYALLAPIFIFFLYIINAFLNVEFFTKVGLDQNGQGFFGSVMYVVIPMLIIYGLVSRGVKIAEALAGEYAKMAQKFATGAAGVAGGVALGGTALAARGVLGATSKTFGTWAGANKDAGGVKGIAANSVNKFLQWGQKSSLDARNTKAFNALGGLGIKTNDKLASSLGIGQKDALGGNVQARKDREKKKDKEDAEKNDMSHLTDEQAKAVWKKMSEREARANAEKVWEQNKLDELKASSPEITALQKTEASLKRDLETAINNKNTTNEKILREQLATNAKQQSDAMAPLITAMTNEKKNNAHHKTTEYEKTLKDAEDKLKQKYGKVESAKDLSSVMRYQYAQRMLEDSMLLSGGEKRSGMWALGGALGGYGGAQLSNKILMALGLQAGLGVSTGGVSILGGILGANTMDDTQQAALNVNKKVIKDFEKAHDPKKNRALKLKQELEELDSLIDGHIEKVIAGTGETLKDLEGNEKRKKEHFDKARSDAQATTDAFKDEYDEFRKNYNREKGKGTMSEQEKKDGMDKLKDLADQHRKAKDESDALNNAHKDREWTKTEIEKEEEKSRNAEEKKKEKEKPKE
jgi:hypothetical protein